MPFTHVEIEERKTRTLKFLFLVEQLAEHKSLNPDTWVRQEDTEQVGPAHRHPPLLQMLQAQYGYVGPMGSAGTKVCPRCHVSLSRISYVEVEQCWMCGLTWLDSDELEMLQCLYETRSLTHPYVE